MPPRLGLSAVDLAASWVAHSADRGAVAGIGRKEVDLDSMGDFVDKTWLLLGGDESDLWAC